MTSNNSTSTIQKLACEMNLPVNTIKQVYERFKVDYSMARVKNYVDILAIRRTKEYLQKLSNGGLHGNT